MSELRSKCCGTKVKKDYYYIQHVDDGMWGYVCLKCNQRCEVKKIVAKIRNGE